jgi:hypothetical protein
MKERITNLFLFVLFSLSTNCCNDSLDLNLQEPDDKIVIDGWIDSGQFAKVLLTRNSPYFSSIDSASLRALVLTRAKVTLTDGEKSEILILRKNEDYFPPYIYEGNEIIGDTGKIYTLTAEYGGKTAWASTTIPPKVKLDTVFFKLEPDKDSLGIIQIEFTDPPEIKNYYRILTKRAGKDRQYSSSMIMGIDDIFFSGQKFGFSLSRGPQSFLSSGGNGYFKLGDTVGIKFCTMDKAQYEFWNSFQTEVLNVSNPFASSLSAIKSNVQGDGLGVWGGYGVSNYTLIIKK